MEQHPTTHRRNSSQRLQSALERWESRHERLARRLDEAAGWDQDERRRRWPALREQLRQRLERERHFLRALANAGRSAAPWARGCDAAPYGPEIGAALEDVDRALPDDARWRQRLDELADQLTWAQVSLEQRIRGT